MVCPLFTAAGPVEEGEHVKLDGGGGRYHYQTGGGCASAPAFDHKTSHVSGGMAYQRRDGYLRASAGTQVAHTRVQEDKLRSRGFCDEQPEDPACVTLPDSPSSGAVYPDFNIKARVGVETNYFGFELGPSFHAGTETSLRLAAEVWGGIKLFHFFLAHEPLEAILPGVTTIAGMGYHGETWRAAWGGVIAFVPERVFDPAIAVPFARFELKLTEQLWLGVVGALGESDISPEIYDTSVRLRLTVDLGH